MKVDFLLLRDVTAMHGDEIREAARRVTVGTCKASRMKTMK